MSDRKTIAVLGGDQRQAACAAYFLSVGYEVKGYGIPVCEREEGILVCRHFKDALADAAAVVLPLPALPDGVHLSLPLAPDLYAPTLYEILAAAPKEAVIFGGRVPPAAKALAESEGRELCDYFESEALQQKNAVPTAEGAVAILMREIPRTVKGLSVAVTGFGRIGKTLAALLLAMGARVTVVARREAALCEAAALGCHTLAITGKASLFALREGFDAIFNTVPYWLFDRDVLCGFNTDTLIVDLASAPGGVEATAAAACGVRVLWALALPGKYAPVSAGQYVGETVVQYLLEGRL